jgi:hypothetical protein
VARAQALNEIPGALLKADPGAPDTWVTAAREAIDGLLAADRSGR